MKLKTIEIIPWVRQWRARHPFYRMDIFFSARVNQEMLGCDYEHLLGVCTDGMMSCYYDRNEVDDKTRNSLSYFADENIVNNFIESATANRLTLISDIEEFDLALATKSDDEIAIFLKEIRIKFELLFASYDISRPEYGVPIERMIKGHLVQLGVSSTDQDDVYYELTKPRERSTLLDEEESWEAIAGQTKGQDNKQVDKLISQHAKKYGWMGMAEQSSIWDKDHYYERLKNQNSQKIAEIANGETDTTAPVPEISDAKIAEYIKVARYLTYERLETRYAWTYVSYLLRNVICEIAKRNGINGDDVENYYSFEEMIALVSTHKLLDVTLMRKRHNYAFFICDRKLTFYPGSEINKITSFAQGEDAVRVSSIIGKSAYRGIEKGYVKIIDPSYKNQQAEVEKMKEGSVLVTSMTRPHLIDAIKKACAIVTDEGGVLSHASIMSREMKKPCIIGTKNATQVLKDGMMVEVDADQGVVRILEGGT